MFYKLHSGKEPTKCYILMFVSQVKAIKSEKKMMFFAKYHCFWKMQELVFSQVVRPI